MKITHFIILYMVLSSMKVLFANETNQAVLIIEGVTNVQLDSVPTIKIVEYGIIDDRVNEIVIPEIKDNKAIYKFKNINVSKTIQFNRSDNIDLSWIPFFVISPGDNINLFVEDNAINFTGLGYEKFECLYMLKRLESRWKENNNFDNFHVQDNLQVLNLQEDLLKTYQNKLEESVYKWILNEIRLLNQITNYALLRYKKKEIIDYKSTVRAVQKLDSKIDARSMSHYFPSYFLGKYIFDLREFQQRKFNFKEAFQYFDTQFHGESREQLLVYLLKNQLRSSTLLPEQLDILENFENETLKSYVELFAKGKIAGMGAPFFSLTGTGGTTYSLNDFSGKVVVLDFWFTGCGACKSIPSVLGPLAERFKHREDIVFLSVSIDKNIDQWKKSLKKGEYTFDHSIKLYTSGAGSSHNIIKDYNVKGYPTILIISKSAKILPLSVNPRLDNGKALQEVISKELNKSSFPN